MLTYILQFCYLPPCTVRSAEKQSFV